MRSQSGDGSSYVWQNRRKRTLHENQDPSILHGPRFGTIRLNKQATSEHEGYQEKDKKNDENNLRDTGSGACDPAETKHSSDQRHNQKKYSQVEHVSTKSLRYNAPGPNLLILHVLIAPVTSWILAPIGNVCTKRPGRGDPVPVSRSSDRILGVSS